MNINIRNGDVIDELKAIPDESVDCMVTDPPYGISFMNKDWDKAVPDVAIWKECLRVMKSGAFAFVMCSPRSDVQAEMVIKLKEAGFEVNYSPIYWTFSQGFPKAANTSLLIDKKACLKDLIHELGRQPTKSEFEEAWGKWRNIIGYKGNEKDFRDLGAKTKEQEGVNKLGIGLTAKRTALSITTPRSLEAQNLSGSYNGYQPKPSVEVIIVAMKPLSEKTYVDQALKNGKGVTWLDDGRIPYKSDNDRDSAIFGTQTDIRGNNYNTNRPSEGNIFNRNVLSSEIGRFPANLLVQDNVLDIGQTTKSRSFVTKENESKGSGFSLTFEHAVGSIRGVDDSGDLSRYFSLDAWYSKNIEELPDYVQRIFPFLYVPKASSEERSEGLNTKEQTVNDGRKKDIDNPFLRGETLRKNIHPTVKPLKLMTYILTIGSRPGDTILDPFMGSGTTGVAAKILHRDFIGFEIERKYFEIAQQRIENKVAKGNITEFEEEE